MKWALLLLLAACSVDHDKALGAQATGGNPDRGQELVRTYGCGACHTVPGVQGANGTVGPPLDKIALRSYLAGHIANTPQNMIRWIQHPQQHEPGVVMPEMGVTDADARDLAAYLYSLR